jgi:hypothetical protein
MRPAGCVVDAVQRSAAAGVPTVQNARAIEGIPHFNDQETST